MISSRAASWHMGSGGEPHLCLSPSPCGGSRGGRLELPALTAALGLGSPMRKHLVGNFSGSQE